MKNSNYTGRCSRTLTEALGPYATAHFEDKQETGYGWLWWAAMAVVSFVGLVVVVMGEKV